MLSGERIKHGGMNSLYYIEEQRGIFLCSTMFRHVRLSTYTLLWYHLLTIDLHSKVKHLLNEHTNGLHKTFTHPLIDLSVIIFYPDVAS